MCGFCGVINKNGSVDLSVLNSMIKRLTHRGPDNFGVYNKKNVGLGHTRLSIIDLSQNGNQPMCDDTGTIWIVYNGEIYNFLNLRMELEQDGFFFQSQTDTEVILYLYKKYGIECLQYLRGMFSFAIWDDREKRLFIARDRKGQKPLIYAETSEAFIFTSEINALIQHPAVYREIDRKSLDLFLSLQYIPAPRTIFKNVKKLPPGHFAILSNGNLAIHKYWELDYRNKLDITEKVALEKIDYKLRESIRLRLNSDVPLGILLSGGVDSSLVAALTTQVSSKKLKTFSIGFEEQTVNELPYARIVADHLGTEHYEFIVKPEEIAGSLSDIIMQYGEPFADKSAIPSFAVSQMAKSEVTVVLNGDGGDELAAGYWRFERTLDERIADFFFQKGRSEVDLQAISKADSIINQNSFWHRLNRKWLFAYRYPELQEVFSGSFWHGLEKFKLWKDSHRVDLVKTNLWRHGILEEAATHSHNLVDRMLWALNNSYLPGDLLVKMDIASMAYGLEARSPLLDHKLIELFASLPIHIKSPKGKGKYLLKKLAAQLVPSHVVYRKKMGFSVPVNEWLRKPLSGLLKEVVSDQASGLNDYFDLDTVNQYVAEHLSGKNDHGFRLWALLVFGIWHQQLLAH